MRRLGVIGTMVWDTIYRPGKERHAVEEWGGIAYTLAAFEATLPADWELVPLIKVGRDLAARANTFLRELTRRAAVARFIEVPEPNNRVTLRYTSSERRTEQLRGGVPGWRWSELGPMVHDLDVIYVNFISGFEMDLTAAQQLRHAFRGPLYADLHSLLLGRQRNGLRVPQSLPDVVHWFSCFDVIQLNEDEMALIGDDPVEVAARALERGVGLLVVTLGARGAAYFTHPPFHLFERGAAQRAPVRTARVAAPAVEAVHDPTGCGDVFGAALLATLIAGRDTEDAIARANRVAARNVQYRGATGLQYHLRGEILRQ